MKIPQLLPVLFCWLLFCCTSTLAQQNKFLITSESWPGVFRVKIAAANNSRITQDKTFQVVVRVHDHRQSRYIRSQEVVLPVGQKEVEVEIPFLELRSTWFMTELLVEDNDNEVRDRNDFGGCGKRLLKAQQLCCFFIEIYR